jgi:UDP-N-acetylmuramate dehydrogenase
MIMTTSTIPVDVLRLHFGDAVQENVLLAPYTSARIGGPADVLVTVKSADELADVMRFPITFWAAVRMCWSATKVCAALWF